MAAKVVQPYNSDKEGIVAEHGKIVESQGDSEFYSMEELDQLEDESMALIVRKFGNFRFRRNPNFKYKSTSNRFQRGGSSSSNSTRGGYKTGMVAQFDVSIAMSSDTLLQSVRSQDKPKGEFLMTHIRIRKLVKHMLLRKRDGMTRIVKMKKLEILH